MRSKRVIAMLLAGGQGSRLGLLTRVMAKPAVPFGGRYRIIDFLLVRLGKRNIPQDIFCLFPSEVSSPVLTLTIMSFRRKNLSLLW